MFQAVRDCTSIPVFRSNLLKSRVMCRDLTQNWERITAGPKQAMMDKSLSAHAAGFRGLSLRPEVLPDLHGRWKLKELY